MGKRSELKVIIKFTSLMVIVNISFCSLKVDITYFCRFFGFLGIFIATFRTPLLRHAVREMRLSENSDGSKN